MDSHPDKYSTLLPELGNLLEEAKQSGDDYQMQFDIEYIISSDYVLAANRKLFEFGLANDSVIVEGPRTIAKLVGKGANGLESIIKFDGWLALTKALDFAATQRIHFLEIEEKSALKYQFCKFLKWYAPVPSNAIIESEVRAAYREYGIEI